MDHRSRSPARLLAPIALVVFTLALFAILVGSDAPDDSSNSNGSQQEQSADTDLGDETTGQAETPQREFYTVQTGDTLAAISESVGVPIERLQELNPELDPQALVSGQKIRLRE